MNTPNPNLYFYASIEEARKQYNSINKPCDLIKSPHGFYVEVRTGDKTLIEIGHSGYTLIAQK